MAGPNGVRLVELRVLEGPNLYFTRPAVKLTLSVPGWLRLSEDRATSLAEHIGLRGTRRAGGQPGAKESERRRRFVARLSTHVSRRMAAESGARVAVRARTGHEPDEIVVAF